MIDGRTAGSAGEPRVSVIIPLFGSHRGAESLPAVARAWLDQEVPCEVVVAIAGGIDVKFDDRAVAAGRVRVIRVGEAEGAPGRLRNIAAGAARAPFLYLSDADILPIGRGYLGAASALLAGGGRVMVQPWLYRLLPGPDWGRHRRWTPPAAKACFVTSDGDGVLTPVPGERFVRADKGLVRLPRDRERMSDPWEQRVLSHFHWGGVFVERALFEMVGGYCTEYLGWGSEDDDLLVKLAGRGELVHAWRAGPALSCLHFEHPRPYGGPGLAPNITLLDARRSQGAEAMIMADVSRRRQGAVPRPATSP